METIYLSVIAGVIAGFIRATLGYLNRPEDEPFRPKCFLRSVIIASIAGAFLAYQIKTTPVDTFFAAIGTDWLLKEGYDSLKAKT